MKVSKRVSRTAGGLTSVTVTVERDGLKSSYTSRTDWSGIAASAQYAHKHAVVGLEALEAS